MHVTPPRGPGWKPNRPSPPAQSLKPGFIRVSMTPGCRASLADAQSALADITSRRQARTVAADLPAVRLPVLANYSEVTDAYLVELARTHGLELATLDDALCRKPWATGVVENPL